MTASVVAFGAVSALGRGEAATSPGRVGAPPTCAVCHDSELAAAGLVRPFAARVQGVALAPGADRAAALLALAAADLLERLELAMPDFRSRRIGVALGTSGGGMPSFEQAIARLDAGQPLDRELARRCPYFGPVGALVSRLGAHPEVTTQLLAACASSTFAIGQALIWLGTGAADLVIAGGYDALSPFIASGFECLGATSAAPAPFRAARAGLALGEGAALLALVRDPRATHGAVLGFGASSDAHHVTAPDRTGSGLASAARLALDDAKTAASEIGLVSAHGTGTSYNDAAEARAIDAVFGETAGRLVVHAFKGSLGHALGAGGALETLGALSALKQGLAPATAGDGEVDPLLRARLLDVSEPSAAGACLKLSSAFGGANAALVLGADAAPAAPVASREVRLAFCGEPVLQATGADLAGRVLTDPVKLGRMDALSAMAVTAAVRARAHAAWNERTLVVVGTAAATLEIDADFERRRKRRGPEPRRFPATSPNLCAGECTIALGSRGPSFSVGASPAAALEAAVVAYDWIASGRVDAAIVIAAEHVGDTVRAVWTAAEWPLPAQGAVAVVLSLAGPGAPLSRARLVADLSAARAGAGALGAEAPGWPSLLAAVRQTI